MTEPLPERLYTAAQSRELDRAAIEAAGIPGFTLMQRAGAAAFDLLLRRWSGAGRVVVVCGGGNNGGDGYIVAARCRRIGMEVVLPALGEPGTDDARAARRQYLDAAEMLSAINRCGAPVLALDIPSGLDSDSGFPLGETVRADATITFIGVKTGLLTGSGPEYAGELAFDDLGVPAAVFAEIPPAARRIVPDSLLTPGRGRDAHKGRTGHALIVGGDHGMAGAALMAAQAAARAGAGLVTAATRPAHASWFPMSRPEIMTGAVETPPDLEPALKRATTVAVGPGLGRGEWGRALLAQVLDAGLPVVVDADGLDLLAWRPRKRGNWVLTPHPGEAARLLDCTAVEIQRDRLGSVREIASRYGGICVLKGPGTLVAGEAGLVDLCDRGNPGMASGGMGDVLTGVIAGLLAQGLEPRAAARLGVWLHSAAADEEAAAGGETGMLATDLLPRIRALLNQVVRGNQRAAKVRRGTP